MGWAARANPTNTPQGRHEAQLRRVLAMFPDRSTYEQWLVKSQMDDAHRAHLEQFLPARLRAQGAV